MQESNVEHGIQIGDIWVRKDSNTTCEISNIMIACGGNALIFFIENGEDKFIEFPDKFCESYDFYCRGDSATID